MEVLHTGKDKKLITKLSLRFRREGANNMATSRPLSLEPDLKKVESKTHFVDYIQKATDLQNASTRLKGSLLTETNLSGQRKSFLPSCV